MAGLGFVALTVRLLVRFGNTSFDIAFLTLPWCAGSFAGILLTRRLQQSRLLGGCFGGAAGALSSYLFDMAVTRNVAPWPLEQVIFIFAWSMSCGMILAGMVALVEDAFPPRGKARSSPDFNDG